VNGLRAAAGKGYAEWIKTAQADIVCLQETKVQPQQLQEDLAQPKGYHYCWNSAQKKGYSGVATFSRTKPTAEKMGIGHDEFDSEGRVIESTFSEFTLLNIYFPNGRRDHSRVPYKLAFCDAVLDRCDELRNKGINLIICGDYNTAHKEIDLKYPKANKDTTGFLPQERAWIDKFIEHGFVDTFRQFNTEAEQYTWWTYRLNARERNIGWRIDYFFINREFLPALKDAFILQHVPGSDHCPLGIELDT
jgi:exodeoxyribonuclease-3